MSANGRSDTPNHDRGGGLAGLVAAIACAEEGAKVRLLEAHEQLGGRARSTDGPYKANLGPHAIYKDGSLVAVDGERDLLPAHVARPRLAGVRMRWLGDDPPHAAARRDCPSVLRLRGREAPVEMDFRTWAASHTDETHGRDALGRRGRLHLPPRPRRAVGGVRVAAHRAPVARAAARPPCAMRRRLEHARRLARAARARAGRGRARPATRADELPDGAGDPRHRARAGCAAAGRREPELAERQHRLPRPGAAPAAAAIRRSSPTWTRPAGSGAIPPPTRRSRPPASELIQAQMPIRPEESSEQAGLRLERLLDARRRRLARARDLAPASGDGRALGRAGHARQRPGATGPPIDRGDGVFLAGDMVAAPGLLAEVSWASAMEAAGWRSTRRARPGRGCAGWPERQLVGALRLPVWRAWPRPALGGRSPTNDGGAIAR